MIRVCIADDHAVVRKGLRQILEETSDMVVSGEAGNGQELLDRVFKGPCDVALVDISMPGRDGLETLKLLKKERPALPVLVLSMYPEEQYAVRALKNGASGYLTKETAPDELVAAIRRVSAGRKYISASLAERLAGELQDVGGKPPHERISDREFQVLCMIGAGKTLSEIAAELSLSVKTISTYRSRILAKSNLKNNSDIIRYVLENALSI